MPAPNLARTALPPRSALTLFNKPYGTLCQFTRDGPRSTLADFISTPDIYPAGRLDADSEGLVLLTADGAFQARLANPRHKVAKTYWVQVEGTPADEQMQRLASGVDLDDFVTRPAHAEVIDEPPGLWPRNPPIRVRRAIPTTWLALTIAEGKNRQVRRMTAAVGLPTLRLVRWRLGEWTLAGLAPGQSRTVPVLESAPADPPRLSRISRTFPR